MTCESAVITLQSPEGGVRYSDSRDHFENAVLRLLRLSPSDFHQWLALAEAEHGEALLGRLSRSYARLRPLPPVEQVTSLDLDEPGPGGVCGRMWHPSIAESPAFGVAGSLDGRIGWLLRRENGIFAREVSPPEYEESYFEGDVSSVRGYGAYGAQAGWRLEKSMRQLREIQHATGLISGRALDVGCGYGYFRKALDAAGFIHDGVEVSAHARTVAQQFYGFQTYPGTLADYAAAWRHRYDLVTLWDVVEHIAEPSVFLSQVAECLGTGGIVAIKTPNLDCPEAECFGPFYHSFKREHLLYFTASSLTMAAQEAGLVPVYITSASHLLTGFFGAAQTQEWTEQLRGADLIAYFQRA